MSGGRTIRILRNTAIGTAMLMSTNTAFANDSSGTAMTAGVIMEKMPGDKRFYFVSGIIEGLAYARFLRDTKASGGNSQTGMNCIYNWFYDDGAARMLRVEAAFKKYPQHFPSVLLTAMIKRKCGD